MIEISELISEIQPENTVLLFGSGSSIPSGAPSSNDLIQKISESFSIDSEDLDLREISTIAEAKKGRKKLIEVLRPMFQSLRPTRGILAIPYFPWKGIYTTNYDQLIEKTYTRLAKPLKTFSSNFDFSTEIEQGRQKLYKLHGTVQKDTSDDGGRSRWIITDQDYDIAEEFREYLFTSLQNDLAQADLIVIGHSLADPDIKEIVLKALELRSKAMNPGGIYLLMFKGRAEKAAVFESRGIKVAVGGIDEFFGELTKQGPQALPVFEDTGNPLDAAVALQPITIDVSHCIGAESPNTADMFNGWPANYAVIKSGATIPRTIVSCAKRVLLKEETKSVGLLGASGVGKTSAARQLMLALEKEGHHCWEHSGDHQFRFEDWLMVAKKLKADSSSGFLFIDDAYEHIYDLNQFFDRISAEELFSLKIVFTSTRNQWNPRIKSPSLLNLTKFFHMEKLDGNEITDLLKLIENNSEISNLVDGTFLSFSSSERRVRLVERCDKDFFVCLKNIYGTEKFDDIVLREYAMVPEQYRDIYKYVAALEHSGVRVHRQLILRLLGVPLNDVAAALSNLTDIIHEYPINERNGIYGWKGRHPVIMGIVCEYKFAETGDFAKLFEDVIAALVPSVGIEVRTMISLCDYSTGIGRLPDKRVQNHILAKMISKIPGERVPRHRLIRNLIDIGQFEDAEAEIRVFCNDFREDGPVYRYRILLLLARSKNSPGLLEEDRVVLLNRARDMAAIGVGRFKENKHMLYTYCDVGVEMYKRTNDLTVFEDAIRVARLSQVTIGDPEITRRLDDYERRVIQNSNVDLM